MAAALAVALGLALVGLPGTFERMSPPLAEQTAESGSVPLAAQGAISGVLGRDDRSYHARSTASGFVAQNRRQSFEARFGAEGVRVRAGTARLGLALRAWGYGGALHPVVSGAPEARQNRVEYGRGPLVEWYVNGPAGLQHGFTLAAPPAIRAGGPLTLALSLSGTLRPALEPGGDGLVLGGSSLRYRGLLAFDATGRELPARLELRGRTLLLRVEDAGARYPLTVDPFLQRAKLTASDGAAGDSFGSVAVSGDTVVVGASGHDVGPNANQGSAYVFVKPPTGWASGTQTAKLTASDGAALDFFGGSVAVSGDTVVVGAGGDDVAFADQGSAYVFLRVEEISVDDVAVTEGDAGTVPATFTVTLAMASSHTVTVDFATADGTAASGSDYVAESGTLTFDPGETSQTVTVAVVGETLDEPDETFFVNLSLPVNAVIVDGRGIGTILNDELLPPPGADHDVGVAGGGFRTKGHIDETRISLGPFDVKIKVKNFGTASEDIFYSVSSSEEGTVFSPACSGVVLDVPPNTAVLVGGCTVTYPDTADPDPVLTLTITHNDSGDGGTDSNTANNSDSQAIVINP